MSDENAAARATAKAEPTERAASQEPSGKAPGGRGPAVLVGITLTILALGAVALLVLAFTMPRWEPPHAAEETGGLRDFEQPLRVSLVRDVRGEQERPPEIPDDAERIQVRLYHGSPTLQVREFRIKVHLVEQEGPLADPDAATTESRIWRVADRLPGVEAVSLGSPDNEWQGDVAVELRLSQHDAPIFVATGERIASLWVSLPYKRHEVEGASALISDTLAAEIVEVDPYLARIDDEYVRTFIPE